MDKYERIWKILIESMNRWIEDTPEEETQKTKDVLTELLEYMINIERWYEDE